MLGDINERMDEASNEKRKKGLLEIGEKARKKRKNSEKLGERLEDKKVGTFRKSKGENGSGRKDEKKNNKQERMNKTKRNETKRSEIK